jgi:osmoprotectant transport system substrate-binding protein
LLALLAVGLFCTPAAACVGRTLVIGGVETPRGQLVAQVIAILINERTGTTVKIMGFPSAEALHRKLATGAVDIAVEHTDRALARLDLEVPTDPEAAYRAAKSAYLKSLNLVWLPPLGFSDQVAGLAAPVARKDTLKKFPALPRLIAKTKDLLPDDVLATLTRAGEPAHSARQFLREKKLI